MDKQEVPCADRLDIDDVMVEYREQMSRIAIDLNGEGKEMSSVSRISGKRCGNSGNVDMLGARVGIRCVFEGNCRMQIQ